MLSMSPAGQEQYPWGYWPCHVPFQATQQSNAACWPGIPLLICDSAHCLKPWKLVGRWALAGALLAITPTAMALAPIAVTVIRRQRAGVVLLVMVFSLGVAVPCGPRSSARSNQSPQLPHFSEK